MYPLRVQKPRPGLNHLGFEEALSSTSQVERRIYWGYMGDIGLILELSRGYIGIMEKNMETTML